jgi:methylthioribose-1-phosphate isomerase
MAIRPMAWQGDRLSMLDQRSLPQAEEYLELRSYAQVADAIRGMAVRGAPAIGVAAAYGMALGALAGHPIDEVADRLVAARPTAVNLEWAVERIRSLGDWRFESVLAEAEAIEREDIAMNEAMGKLGAELIEPGSNVMTICNTGSLATAGHGTALGIIRTAHKQGKRIHVWSCETRPRQQGLRLTAFELMKEGIPFHSIADSAAASLMRSGQVNCVIVGADRIASNGDTANKIGTYSLAVLARYHGVPFYVAAPSSTLDAQMPSGESIPIEERDGSELATVDGHPVGPEGCPVFNPAFDVTPGNLISAIVTEGAVHRQPFSFGTSFAD